MASDGPTAPLGGESTEHADAPTVTRRAAPPVYRTRGAVIGRFVIIDHLGSGGMGDVYLAYDPELHRQVAIKVIREAARGSTNTRARLMREAQALAKVSHAHVISIFDVGTNDEEIFLVSEFVDGGTLTGWLAAGPRAWRDVVDIFVKAGRGLTAAHAAGIIHRDFKPDNVLIGKDGRVRVTDFGLARAAGETTPDPEAAPDVVDSASGERGALHTPLTAHGAIVGTPSYMSPEQQRGRPADERSDQFSFCVSLYEGLYHEHPFQGTTPTEVSRAIRKHELRPPARDTRVPARIRNALLRGLSAESAERHPTLDSLLDELGRAGAAARRRTVVPLVGLAVAVVSAAAATAYGVARGRKAELCSGGERELAGVWDGERRERARLAFLATGKPFAQASWERVAPALDARTAAWLAMRREACEATRIRGVQSAELLDRRMACLAQRRAELDALVDLFGHADAKVVEKAVPAEHGLPPIASCADLPALTAAIPRPRADQMVAAGQARGKLARVTALANSGKYADGLALAREAAADADRVGYDELRAEAQFSLGNLLLKTGDDKGAADAMYEALWTAESTHDDRLAAEASVHLVFILGDQPARFDEGRRAARQTGALIARAGGLPDVEVELHSFLGNLAFTAGKYTDALAEDERALALQTELARGKMVLELARLHNNLGNALYALRRHEESITQHRQALAMKLSLLGPDHPDVATSRMNLGNPLMDLGRLDEALDEYERALTIGEAALGPNHPWLAQPLNNVGMVLMLMDRNEEAIGRLTRALAIGEASLGPDQPDVANINVNLGEALVARGDLLGAETSRARAMEVLAKGAGADHPYAVGAFMLAGKIALGQGRSADAFAAYQRGVAIAEKDFGKDNPAVATPLLGLGRAYLTSRAPERAIEPLRRVLELSRSGSPDEDGDAAFALAQALTATGGDPAEATVLTQRARDDYLRMGKWGTKKLDKLDAWRAGKDGAPGSR